MKRNSNRRREFSRIDIDIAFEGLADYSKNMIQQVASGRRHNRNIWKALLHAKKAKETAIHQIAKKY